MATCSEYQVRLETAIDPVEWDLRVESLNGGFFHCHAYATFEARAANADPLFITVLGPEENVCGLAVGVLRRYRLWPLSRYSGSVMFGTLPVINDYDAERLRLVMSSTEHALRAAGICELHVASYDSLRSSEILPQMSYRLVSRSEFYIDLTRSPDDLFSGFKGTRRNDIRRAGRSGITTRRETSLDSYNKLLAFMDASLRRHGERMERQSDDEAEQLERLLEDSGRARLFVSYLDNMPVNAALFGVFGTSAYYVYSGSCALGNRSNGPAHLLWTAMLAFRDEGIEVLNLGGVKVPSGNDDPAYGLYRFKRNFGGREVDQPSGSKTLSVPGHALSRAYLRLRRLIRH